MEHATFTPLVMSATGGMGRAATTFYRRLASMISEKRNTEYSQTVNWIRCKLSFALLRALIMSIRGARSSRHHFNSWKAKSTNFVVALLLLLFLLSFVFLFTINSNLYIYFNKSCLPAICVPCIINTKVLQCEKKKKNLTLQW